MKIVYQNFNVVIRGVVYQECFCYADGVDWQQCKVFIIPGLAKLVIDSFENQLLSFLHEHNIVFVSAELYFTCKLSNLSKTAIPQAMQGFANDIEYVRHAIIKTLVNDLELIQNAPSINVLTHSALFFIAYELNCSCFGNHYDQYFCVAPVAGDMNSAYFMACRKHLMLSDKCPQGEKKLALFYKRDRQAQEHHFNFIQYYEKVLMPLMSARVEFPQALQHKIVKHLQGANPEVISFYFSLLKKYPMESLLQQPQKPMLLFLGDCDYIAPGQMWYNRVRKEYNNNQGNNLILQYIADSGHYPHYENYASFHAVVKQYLHNQ